MLVALRTCNADMTSRDGFQWPTEVGGIVTAPDWADSQKCGAGLHGLLWGQGDWSLLAKNDEHAKWVVYKPLGGIAHLGGKIKSESAEVLFIGARLDAWTFIRQYVADLRDADLRDANLTGADLRDANLTDANLRDANLTDANLTGADLPGANLTYANLRGANLTYANLRDANLRYANLRDADLRGADLTDANLTGANLRGANLMDANTNEYTVLPEGVVVS